MNAKELADALRRAVDEAEKIRGAIAPSYLFAMATHVERLHPRYRSPQPSDDGRWCYLEELPDDAPPTLVQTRPVASRDDQATTRFKRQWQFWTVAGWRELTKGVWPCERPEGGGA